MKRIAALVAIVAVAALAAPVSDKSVHGCADEPLGI